MNKRILAIISIIVAIPLIIFLVIPTFGVVWWQSFDPRDSGFLDDDRFPDCELAIFSGDDGVCLRAEQVKNLDWSSVETCEQTGKVIKCSSTTYPTIFTTSPERCAELFDRIFDTWKQYVKENYGGPGQPTLEPPTVAGLISGWEGGEEFRNTDCRLSVDNWGYLAEHQEQVWGYVDWPKLEPFKYIPPKYGDAYTYVDVLLGEPKQDKLLPIIIREYTRKANDFDTITSWNFAFVKNTADTQKTEYWKFLPQDERISYNVIGGDFTSIIDESRKHSFDMPDTGYVVEVDCENTGLKDVTTAVPVTIPIISDNYHVIVEHKVFGIYPNENDVYSFKMASFFHINDNFPDNAVMLSEKRESCDWVEKPSSELIDPEYPTEPTYVEWKFKSYEKRNPE